jgi:site-specific DNA-methyltransferase (adenine-specific)
VTPYYEDAAVTVYHANCMDILAQIEDVDHVISDPPYSDTTHEGARTGDSANAGVLVDFASVNVQAIRDALALVSINRWGILTVDWQHVLPLKEQPPRGWRFVRHGAWVKPNGTPQFTGDRPAQGWEAVAILHADTRGRMRWNGGGLPAVWTHLKVAGYHPTGKPESLISDFVMAFTDEGDLILDPFAGSGTTGVAAKRLGRRAILIEKEEKYCEVAARRLSQGALGLGFASDAVDPVGRSGKDLTRTADLLADLSEDGYGHGV